MTATHWLRTAVPQGHSNRASVSAAATLFLLSLSSFSPLYPTLFFVMIYSSFAKCPDQPHSACGLNHYTFVPHHLHAHMHWSTSGFGHMQENNPHLPCAATYSTTILTQMYWKNDIWRRLAASSMRLPFLVCVHRP